jgi:hypothetical protein
VRNRRVLARSRPAGRGRRSPIPETCPTQVTALLQTI